MKNKKIVFLALLLILAVVNVKVFLISAPGPCNLENMTSGICMQRAFGHCDYQCYSHGGCYGVTVYMNGCVEGLCEAEYVSVCNDGYEGDPYPCSQAASDCDWK